jgi:hypothetical protein
MYGAAPKESRMPQRRPIVRRASQTPGRGLARYVKQGHRIATGNARHICYPECDVPLKTGICHLIGDSACAVVHTLQGQGDGVLVTRASHSTEITSMLKHTGRSLSLRPFEPRRDQRMRKAPESIGSRDLLASSMSSASLSIQIDKFLHACWLPARWSQRIWMPSDLPPCLEQRTRSLSPDAIWRAYTDGARLWFAVATAAVSASYGPSAVAIEVSFFENDGLLCSGGVWTCHPDGHWRLERLVGMSAESRFDWSRGQSKVDASPR